MDDIKVSLMSYTPDPQTSSVAGALACFEEASSLELWQDLRLLPGDKRGKKERAVLKNSLGRGHGSVGDQNCFIFSIQDLPRLATLFLCLPGFLAHLQQSLRRASASRGSYLPLAIRESEFASEVEDVLSASFGLYGEMVKAGVPKEDARFLLPLYTRTNIQTAGNARELSHLRKMSQGVYVPSVVKAVVEQMMIQAEGVAPYLFEDFGFNYEPLAWCPSARLYYAPSNPVLDGLIKQLSVEQQEVALVSKSTFPLIKTIIDQAITGRDEASLAVLKHLHFEFLCSMSLACFHQAIRQRTWDHATESIYSAAEQGLNNENRMVVPPSIKDSDFHTAYRKQHFEMLNLYAELAEAICMEEAIGVIPHSLKIHTWVHVNGWNAIYAIGKRTCTAAQWEIRAKAKRIASIIKSEFPSLGFWAEPQCIAYGRCSETEDCGYYKKAELT